MILRHSLPVTPPLVADDDLRAGLAAALLFTVTPSDRALAGWSGSGEAALQLEDLGVISATREAG